jgi:hypothetical protein
LLVVSSTRRCQYCQACHDSFAGSCPARHSLLATLNKLGFSSLHLSLGASYRSLGVFDVFLRLLDRSLSFLQLLLGFFVLATKVGTRSNTATAHLARLSTVQTCPSQSGVPA